MEKEIWQKEEKQKMSSSKKSRKISVKLTESEYCRLEKNAELAGMKLGPYVRKCIESNTMTITPKAANLATMLCKLHVTLADKGLNDDEAIMKELKELWLTLL